MFRLYQISPTAGDCTALYKIIMDKEYTVRELVGEILTKKEWGKITINNFTNISFSYANNKCDVLDSYRGLMERKVIRATGHGGWGNMDYNIYI